ncbi:MAG: hypothetical protein EA381_17000 [Planctomycetaceae bacterium]|nr:MAG: hypothetical protein EA381_17000 [Planctomycetaceae bacterium]
MNHPTRPAPIAAAASGVMPPSNWWRLGASVLIIGHVWALLGRPLEFATQGPFGPSPSMTRFRDPVRAYSQFAYLDHGYAFFAPEPGPSHLIRATIRSGDAAGNADQDAAGEATSEVNGDTPGVQQRHYPDRADQWPRLLYHRHFMLAEFLNDVYHPPGEPPQEIASDPLAVREWIGSRQRYERVRDSIRRRLESRHPDAVVEIERIEHRQPGLPEFRDGVTLDAPDLYSVLPDLPLTPPTEVRPMSREPISPEPFSPGQPQQVPGMREFSIPGLRLDQGGTR